VSRGEEEGTLLQSPGRVDSAKPVPDSRRPLLSMNSKNKSWSLLPLALLTIGSALGQNQWEIDSAHSAAQFAVRHMMVSTVRGEFGKLSGSAVYDPQNPSAASIEVTIDATTINTREQRRDEHLRSADFFDVAKYPTITFKSKQVKPLGNGKMEVHGDLTMHGVTREVVLDVSGLSPEIKDQRGNARIGASATTRLNRRDFGLNWNRAIETGGVVVADEVDITLDLELVKKTTPKQTSEVRENRPLHPFLPPLN